MRLKTHDRTAKVKMRKNLKVMFAVCFSLTYTFFVFIAIACSLYIHSITPALMILIPVLMLTTSVIIFLHDMNRAYIEINGETVTVTDYYYCIKKKKSFLLQDIVSAEIVPGSSLRVRGYRYSTAGIRYIVFKGRNNKYLFKIIHLPETEKLFQRYISNRQ